MQYDPDPLDVAWSEGYGAGWEDAPRTPRSSIPVLLALVVGVVLGSLVSGVVRAAAVRFDRASQVGLNEPISPVESLSGELAAKPFGGAPTPSPTGEIGTAMAGGTASWYFDGAGLYAAVPGWHFGDRRYVVRVCRGDDASRCVSVQVRDCLCGRTDRIIDLSRDAFARLAPLSAGLLRVTVEWVNGPLATPPQTDTLP